MTQCFILVRDYRHSQTKHRPNDWRTVVWAGGSFNFSVLVLWAAKGAMPHGTSSGLPDRYAIRPPRRFT